MPTTILHVLKIIESPGNTARLHCGRKTSIFGGLKFSNSLLGVAFRNLYYRTGVLKICGNCQKNLIQEGRLIIKNKFKSEGMVTKMKTKIKIKN